MDLTFLKIILLVVVVYVLYKLVYKRENFDGTPMYATLGAYGSVLLVGLFVYLVYTLMSVKNLMSLQLVR